MFLFFFFVHSHHFAKKLITLSKFVLWSALCLRGCLNQQHFQLQRLVRIKSKITTLLSRKRMTQAVQTIRIFHEREGRIEKPVPRIAVWHLEACRVMTNGDPEGRIFLSYPHMNNGFLFLLTTVFIYLFIYLF